MKILLLDKNHLLLSKRLEAAGFDLEEDYTATYAEVADKISSYDGIIIRSRIPLDRALLSRATHLKFIGRVGAGLENIDAEFAAQAGIKLFNAPEGNRDAVAEHVLGMLLSLMHRLRLSAEEVRHGIWEREGNRGDELQGKTVALIGYGNMGKAVAKRFSGFGVKVLFNDILPDLSDGFAAESSLKDIQAEADIISLHLPLSPATLRLINADFISAMQKKFYLINTARGKNIDTSAVVEGLKSGKIKGAGLDVLEYEKTSFESLDAAGNADLHYLLQAENVLITPHIAGWSHQSKEKLANIIADKIVAAFPQS